MTPLLSPRQLEILRLFAAGLSYKEVAAELGIKRRTVRNHVTKMNRTLGTNDKTGAVLAGLRLGLVDLDAAALGVVSKRRYGE